MRRLALIVVLIGLGAASMAAMAGADEERTYTIELDNAFGIVEGSEVRVAGVPQGEVTDLHVSAAKRAVLTAELTGPMSLLGEDTICSSEPQSLVSEYFLNCDPQGPPREPTGSLERPDIPVRQTRQTVQPDLVQNTFREPFNRRLQLVINSFGTALAGNAENLNAAIRRGAPALRELRAALRILGDQNRIIRGLTADADRILVRLAARRGDVARFIEEARDTAVASAGRRAELSRDFEILDDFLAELRPTMARLGELAHDQTPLLADLRVAGPGLNRLAQQLPGFGDSAGIALRSLGDAGVVGRRALRKGRDEIRALRRATRDAPASSGLLADLARDLDDPRRAVEIDRRAGRDTGRTDPRPGRRDTMGYTGLEGLLNYVYYQTGALNQFDQVSHMLHFSLYEVDSGPCGHGSTGGRPGDPEFGVPATGGGHTTSILAAHPCVAWLGPRQPRLSEPLELPRYDPSVCPEGSDAPELCNPAGGAASRAATGDAPPAVTGDGPARGRRTGVANAALADFLFDE
jgi:ABC-type transporter Mla subunit MlaD